MSNYRHFTLGMLFGILATMLCCWLVVWQTQPRIQSAALADKKITEIRLNANTYIYSVNHTDTELDTLDDDMLLKRMAERTKENEMSRFVMIKVEPKMFCSAVAVHPAANVIVMRPLDDDAPEIVELDERVNKSKDIPNKTKTDYEL